MAVTLAPSEGLAPFRKFPLDSGATAQLDADGCVTVSEEDSPGLIAEGWHVVTRKAPAISQQAVERVRRSADLERVAKFAPELAKQITEIFALLDRARKAGEELEHRPAFVVIEGGQRP